jgi:hypothetical protein
MQAPCRSQQPLRLSQPGLGEAGFHLFRTRGLKAHKKQLIQAESLPRLPLDSDTRTPTSGPCLSVGQQPKTPRHRDRE